METIERSLEGTFWKPSGRVPSVFRAPSAILFGNLLGTSRQTFAVFGAVFGALVRPVWLASAATVAPAGPVSAARSPPAERGFESVDELYREGVRLFAEGDAAASARAFDGAWEAAPVQVRRRLWQRGISLYYSGRFAEGADQFREDAVANAGDSEEAIWCFLCEAQSLGPRAARERFVQTSGTDPRPLLRAARAAFEAGTGHESILASAPPAGRLATVAPRGLKDLFYATLYAGLYCEAEGRDAEARDLLTTAAEMKYANRSGDYMGAVARVHCKCRGWI